jgi:hypothetical protein
MLTYLDVGHTEAAPRDDKSAEGVAPPPENPHPRPAFA